MASRHLILSGRSSVLAYGRPLVSPVSVNERGRFLLRLNDLHGLPLYRQVPYRCVATFLETIALDKLTDEDARCDCFCKQTR